MTQYLVYPYYEQETGKTFIHAVPAQEASPVMTVFSRLIPEKVKRITARNEKIARLMYNLIP